MDKIRFFPAIEPGQELKQDWSKAYQSEFPTVYRNELMQKCQIHAKDGLLNEIFDREAYPKLSQIAQVKPIYCVDVLSAYGNSFLATVHGMSPEEIYDAWSNEQNSLTAVKSRRFDCDTLAIDISRPALEYGKKAGIFDSFISADINNLSGAEEEQVSESLKAAHFVHLGSPGYITIERFNSIVETFSKGSEYGVLIVTFNYLFMKHHKEFKKSILEKLNFVNCVGGMQRDLVSTEIEHYKVARAYTTTWVMER
ncbi:MAG: hypothetical protein ACFB9N_19145 [Geitlerinemataceae cyanobacterium]